MVCLCFITTAFCRISCYWWVWRQVVQGKFWQGVRRYLGHLGCPRDHPTHLLRALIVSLLGWVQ